MDDTDALAVIKIVIEVGEDGVFKVQSNPPDEDALIAALKMALFAVTTKVDSNRCLH